VRGVSSPNSEPWAFVFSLFCFPVLCPVFTHLQTMKNLHVFSVFRGWLRNMLLAREYALRKLAGALRNSVQKGFYALCLGYLQSCYLYGELLPPRRERPLAFVSRACASRGDEGGEVCSRPSARASLSMSPARNPAAAGGPGTPALAAGSQQ